MSIREGRGRPPRDYPLRSEERSHHGRGANPPSRHLWVGNLSHSLSESAFARYFLRYGELESVAFQPGRSYAFVNYRNDEDAIAAIKDLQGFELAGNPMRIEFAKAEKASAPPADYIEGWDGPRSKPRASPLRQDYPTTRRPSPEPLQLSKSKMQEKDAEPSEVLWVGFPAHLKVDEFILRKAFSPFGDIEKITAFPGRTYAFIRYRNVAAAFRAKEALHGKLFGNPRVHICFARNESGPSSNRERSTSNAPPSPYAESYERGGRFEHYRSESNFNDRSPPYIPNMDPGFDLVGSKRSRGRPGEIDDRGMRMFHGLERNFRDYPDSPLRNVNTRIHEFSHHDIPRQEPLYDDPWDLPEDTSLLPGAKKLKSNAMPLDNELPEYPFSDLEKVKHKLPQDLRKSTTLDGKYDPRYPENRRIPNHFMNPSEAYGKRDDDQRNVPLDHYRDGLAPPPHQSRRRLAASDSRETEVWKWEGIIAKGGSSVCEARCFPVGKPPDVVLPEYLDCNARTSLDMLAKHYYQATSAHVVFFVPANDPDISYYNEFRNYLEEKQRVAVAKLDETTTLFLVPPSEFSEKVLKVPGNLSISGVVLRLDNASSGYGTIPQHNERNEAYLPPSQSNVIHQRPISPSGSYLPPPPLPSFSGNMPSAPMRTPSYNTRPVNPQGYELPHSNEPTDHAYYSMTSRSLQESAHTADYNPELSRNPLSGNGRFSGQEKPHVPSSSTMQSPSEQLAQLTSSLLGKQGRMGSASVAGEYQPQANVNQQNYNLPNNQGRPESSTSQVGQVHMSNLVASQRDHVSAGQEDGEGDPQNRLQATLQLAAALLQQIQQGKGN